MRVAIISDVHANLPALDAVLQRISEYDCDAIWCLGDVLGYGPHPETCVQRIQQQVEVCLAGNHDQALLGRLTLNQFNPVARQAIQWQTQKLSPQSLAWLQNRPSLYQMPQLTLAHGSPRHPVWEYVHDVDTAAENFSHFSTPLCLVGHTHVAIGWRQTTPGDRPQAVLLPPGEALHLTEGARWILNPGSVGQPRDADPSASFAVLDIDQHTWTWHRQAYDIDVVSAAIRQAGLPELLATRLYLGW